MANAYTYRLGIDGPVKIGTAGAVATQRLLHISGPTLNITSDMEELDIVAVGLIKAYVEGKRDISISFTVKDVRVDNASPADISMLRAAYKTRTPISVLAEDSSIGNIDGDFLISKMEETRENGKVISWNTELKPTYVGRMVQFSEPDGT